MARKKTIVEPKELSRDEKAMALESAMADIGKIKLINEAIVLLNSKAVKRVGEDYATLADNSSHARLYDDGTIYINLRLSYNNYFTTAEFIGYNHFHGRHYKDNPIKLKTEVLLEKLDNLEIINYFLKFAQNAESDVC